MLTAKVSSKITFLRSREHLREHIAFLCSRTQFVCAGINRKLLAKSTFPHFEWVRHQEIASTFLVWIGKAWGVFKTAPSKTSFAFNAHTFSRGEFN